jgi:hypothetical protein
VASGRVAQEVLSSEEQRRQLGSFARSRSLPHAQVERAQIVLMAADGLQNICFAAQLGITREKVSKWPRRFGGQGIQGLCDEFRPARPRSVEDERVAALIRKTLGTKPVRGTHWSCRSTSPSLDTDIRSASPSCDLLHVLLDNYASHKHPKVKEWLLRHPRYHLHFNPTIPPGSTRWRDELRSSRSRRFAWVP